MKKTLLFYISISVFFITAAGCGVNVSKISRPLLGTIVTITISGDPEKKSEDFNAAFNEIESVQRAFNPYNPESVISIINSGAADKPVKTGEEVFRLISRSLEISRITGGAFDITFASTGKLWDFSKEDFTPPDEKTIKKMLPLISYKNIILDEKDKTIHFLKKGTKIGLGGIAKGYATFKAVSVLKERKVKGAIVASAGDIQVIGDNNGKPWRTGIQDPRGDSVIAAIDMLDGEAVSTSGDYERFRMVNGRRYHHIIDPATGHPADSGLISVSVFSTDPVLSDACSTAFFISGLEKTKSILASKPALSAVLVTSGMKVYVSKILKGRITFRNGLEVIYF
jgi:thiamine biosynthesis lipoprotein